MCLVRLSFDLGFNINVFGHIKSAYLSRFFKTKKGLQERTNFGKHCHNYVRVTKTSIQKNQFGSATYQQLWTSKCCQLDGTYTCSKSGTCNTKAPV